MYVIKGAMQRDFDDLILASPIIKIFGDKLFFFFLTAKNDRILHKNDCERKSFYMVKTLYGPDTILFRISISQRKRKIIVCDS